MMFRTAYSLTLTVALAAMIVTSASAFASEADKGIETAFENSYVYKTYLKEDSVKMNAKDGIVTLTGTVVHESHKALAQDTAEGLAGVVRVDNQLATAAEVAADKSDTWISRKVKLALLFHRSVNLRQTEVAVKDGVVTLKGEASTAAQKELSTEYAKDIENVKEVKNEMTVAAKPEEVKRTEGEKVDDASVTAQVKSALLTHRSTSAAKTKVQTRNGEVTLTGIANNAAEKALVTKLTADIQGVTNVKNEMTVEEVKTK